jgi:hypothetical protein
MLRLIETAVEVPPFPIAFCSTTIPGGIQPSGRKPPAGRTSPSQLSSTDLEVSFAP